MVPLVLALVLSACANSPTQITSRDPRDQTRDEYYTSGDSCGLVVAAEKRYAVFALEQDTALGGTRLMAWLYNLGDSELRVRVHTFSYHRTRIFVRQNMAAAPGARIKILDRKVEYEILGVDNALSYDLSVARSRDRGLIELRNRRAQNSSLARHACDAPKSSTDIVQRGE